jgi:hypothetical protein
MIVQPHEPAAGSMLEHVCDADQRGREKWVTDEALWIDEHGRVRINYSLVDRVRAEPEPSDREARR